MSTRILPANVTPLNPLLNKVDDWQEKDVSFVKKHALSRLIVVVVGPCFAAISALYNAFAFTVKAPVTLLKYTILFVPVRSDWTTLGTLILPEGFELTEMSKHIYKIVMFTIDIGFCPLMGAISPSANIAVHEFFGLIERNPKSINSKPTINQPIGNSEVTPPQIPPAPIPTNPVKGNQLPIGNPPPPPPPPQPKGSPAPKTPQPPKGKPVAKPTTPQDALQEELKNRLKNRLKPAPTITPVPAPAPIITPPPVPTPKGRPLPVPPITGKLPPAPTSPMPKAPTSPTPKAPTSPTPKAPTPPSPKDVPPPPPPGKNPPKPIAKAPVGAAPNRDALMDQIRNHGKVLKPVDQEDPRPGEVDPFFAAIRARRRAHTSHHSVWE